MKKRLFVFGLILCLILVSGWTGREFPFHSFDAGDFYYQSEHSMGGTGMTGAPVSDKAVWLSADEIFFGRETDRKLIPAVSVTDASFHRISYADKYQVVALDIGGNDQLNLIAMAPRA